MKTERRHELQKNQLADWIGHQVEHVKPHGKTVLAAGILGAAVIIAALVILKDRESVQGAAWTELHIALAARDSAQLADVAKRHSGTPVALWAKQAQADIDLDRGIDALYSNREDATMALSDARRAYSEVIAGATSIPELLQKAQIGMAKAQEASSNLDAAKDYYQRVIERFPDSVVAKDAKQRLAAVNDPETVKLYQWFSRQKPKPNSRSGLPNLPGMPDNLLNLPDSPNFLPVPEGGPLSTPKDVRTLPESSDLPPDPDGGPLFPAESLEARPESTTAPLSSPNSDKKESGEAATKTDSSPPNVTPSSEKDASKDDETSPATSPPGNTPDADKPGDTPPK